jgi:hypothetical protein
LRRERSAPPPPSLGPHGFAGEPSGSGDSREDGSGALDAAARVPPMSPEEGDAGVWFEDHSVCRVTAPLET